MKSNKNLLIIDLNNKVVKGYTTAKEFKKQIIDLKNIIGVDLK